MLELYGLHTGGIDYGNRPHVVTFYDGQEFVGRLIRKYGAYGDDTQPLEVDTYTIDRDNLIILKREAAETNDINKNYDYFILRNFIKDVTPTIRIYDYDFFIVDRVEKRSGKIYYYCHKDLWAYGQARLFNSTLHVTKSNKHLTDGVFDDIKLLTATKFIENLQTYSDNFNPQYIKGDDVMIVFKAKYNVKEWGDLSGNMVQSRIGLFGFLAKAIRTPLRQYIIDNAGGLITQQALQRMLSELANKNAILTSSDLLSGIYGFATGAGSTYKITKAEIMKAWVVDKRLLEIDTNNIYETPIFYTWGYVTLTNVTLKSEGWPIGVNSILPRHKELTITRPQFSSLSNREFLGTEENNLELTRYVDTYPVKITCITSNSSIQIMAECGSEKVDITSAFELDVTKLEGDTTPDEKTSKFLNYLFANFSHAGNMASKNDAKGITKAGLDYLGWGLTSSYDLYHNVSGLIGGNIGEGDAMKNFVSVPYNPNGQSADYEFLNPYKVIKFASPAFTELRHAGLEGVNYDLFMRLSNILSASLLEQDIITSEGASISPITTFTYLKVDNLNLSFRYGQSEVYDFIQKELLRGVYLIDITNA